MENNERLELVREHIHRLTSPKYIPLRLAGYSRFSIENQQIVRKSLRSTMYSAFCLIVATFTLIHIVYETTVRVQYLLYTELVILMELTAIIYLLLLNLSFSNRRGVAKLINYSIEIDMLLGMKETKFMRDVVDVFFNIMSIPIVVMQVTVVTFMYFTFDVTFAVHITGSAYFIWVFCVFFDLDFLLSLSSFLALRTKYLNVALAKSLNVNLEYVPEMLTFSGLFWKKKHNDLVTFHKKADIQQFVEAYKMLFNYMQYYQECYRFLMLAAIACITIGALLSVQTVIIYGRTGMDMFRRAIMVGWLSLSWSFFFSFCLVIDLFSRHIDQTKLICTFAYLKDISNEAVYGFTKAILHALEIRVARMSIYGLMFLDPGVVLRIAASTFVYVTAQLQLTMPEAEPGKKFRNNSTTY